MAPTKVIRVAEDVWAELQLRAVPLEDDVNSVLRKVLGLRTIERGTDKSKEDGLIYDRVSKIRELVEEEVGQEPEILRTSKERRYKFLSNRGSTVAYMLFQPRMHRLRITTAKGMAVKAGIEGWSENDVAANGWFKADDSVRFYFPDGDEGAYSNAAEVLAKLWGQ